MMQYFVRKPFYVRGMQVTPENMEQVAAWCRGEIKSAPMKAGMPPAPYILVPVHRPRADFHTRAYVNNWVLQSTAGFKIYTEKALSESFDFHNGFDALEGPAEYSAVIGNKA